MSFANPNYSDVLATTIQSRSKQLADNVTKNNAIVHRLNKKGKIKPVSGGSTILQELSFAENGNFAWYSGYDLLSVAAADVVSAAEFTWKQCACPVIMSGLEELQNSGEEAFIDLLEERIGVAEATMSNNMSAGIYSDGTGYGGKQLGGLGALVTAAPATGVVGGIDRSIYPFWRNQVYACGANPTAATIQPFMNNAWVQNVRGTDHSDLILFDNNLFTAYLGSLQNLQRFTDPELADLGFQTIKYMNADVVLDGGIGGFCPSFVGYYLNTNYIFLRPHKNRNMVPLSPNRRVSTNQDAEVQIIAWAGAFTTSGAQFQTYFRGS